MRWAGLWLCFVAQLSIARCELPAVGGVIDQQRLLQDLRIISADSMQGRRNDSEGAELTRLYLEQRFSQMGVAFLEPHDSYRHPFVIERFGADITGVNILGWIPGNSPEHGYLVVTAHYDHLGSQGSTRIFNGANDNASGVAALLAFAEMARQHPLHHHLVLLATDAEERGLHGARAFLQSDTVAPDKIAANLNLDMLGHPGKFSGLYVSGRNTHPLFIVAISQVEKQSGWCLKEKRAQLKLGFRGAKRIDYRRSSDHYPFLRLDIPYLFVGGSDNPFYHKFNDEYGNIDKGFFIAAAETSWLLLQRMDEVLANTAVSDDPQLP